jgi:hypothetical protein
LFSVLAGLLVGETPKDLAWGLPQHQSSCFLPIRASGPMLSMQMRAPSNTGASRRSFLQLGIVVGLLPVIALPDIPPSNLKVSARKQTIESLCPALIPAETGKILRIHDSYKIVQWFCRKYLTA